MRKVPVNITIEVEVFDERALWQAAIDRARDDGLFTDEPTKDVLDMLGDPDHAEGSSVDLAACLIMLLDPGESPPGCEIQQSSGSAEHWLADLMESADA